MTQCYEAQTFIRHHRQLRAVMLENQAWFSLQDTARLMGKSLDERATRKLDPDQCRTEWLKSNGEWSKQLLISESGLFAMLVHHYAPENRALRHWFTHDVLPALRPTNQSHGPRFGAMKWAGNSVGLLFWQSDYWVRLSDMPSVIGESPDHKPGGVGVWKKLTGYWQRSRVMGTND